jgi:protein O-mannosyl-transferase
LSDFWNRLMHRHGKRIARMSGRSKKRTGRESDAGGSSCATPKRSLNQSASIWNQRWILGVLLILATTIAYQKAWHAGYIWDDDIYVTGNRLLTAPDGLRRIWFSLDSPSQYFPLVYTTFRLEHAAWGLNPAGYHWVNILLHLANALLVWRLLRILRVPGAWLAAAIFALHPVQVESAAWITERKNVLMGLFFLLALLSWVEFVEEQSRRMWKFYALALIFYALALFSKTTACTLPAALLLILWLKEKAITRGRLMQITPFVALGLVMGLVSIWWERYHQGTQGQLYVIGLPERVLIASRAFWFYLGKLLWPTNLSFIYPRWPVSATNPFDYVWLLAAVGLGVAICFARRYVGRAVEVAVLFFVATLSPMLGFVMMYAFRFSFVSDHYQYLAAVGPLALAAAGITTGFRVIEKKSPLLKPVVCGVLLLSLGVLTWRQCAMYADIETLWRTTISKSPDSWMAYNNLATRLLQIGRTDEAIAHFQKALQIDPNYATGHNNLGNALLQIGRVDESLAHLRRALEIDPNYATAHNNLGNTLLQMGRLQEAIDQYKKAFEIAPYYFQAYNNLGAALLQVGRLNESLANLKKALEIDPEYPEAHNNLANTLLRMGRVDEALAHYNKALEKSPQSVNTLNNFAWLLATSPEARLRNGPRAAELAERADRLTAGNNPVVIATLAAAYAEVGRFPEAVKTAQRALDLAIASGNHALADAINAQIELYQSGSPSREKP